MNLLNAIYTEKISMTAISRWFLVFTLATILAWPSPNNSRLLAQDDSGEATESNDDGPKSSPDALVIYNDAASYQNNGALELAAQEWQKFIKQHPQDPKVTDAKYNLGVCFLQSKDFGSAVKTLSQIVNDANQDFERREDAILNLGWSLYSLGLEKKPERFVEANEVFGKLITEFPKGQFLDQAHFFQGESYYMQGKREEAAKAYQSLVDGFPESDMRADGMYALGVSYEELGKFEPAGKTYDLFLDEFSDHALANEVSMRKAETILRAGNYQEAEKRFAAAAQIKDFASADHALYRQAFCVAEQKRFKDAGDLFASLTDKHPESRYYDQATMAAGRAYFRAKELDLATQWFDGVLDSNSPFVGEAAHWRCRILLDSQRPDEALKLADKHLKQSEKSPFFVNLVMDRADAMYEIPNRRDEAFNLYKKIAGDFGDHTLGAQALYNAAFAAMELKKPDAGLSLAKQFLEKYTKHRLSADVKHVAAECELQLGNNSSAAKLFAEVSTESNMKSGVVDVRRALALYLEKNYDQAIALLTEKLPNIKEASEQAEAHYVVGISQLGLRQYQQAEASLKKTMSLKPDFAQADEVLLHLSMAQRKQQRLDEAIATAEAAVKKYQKSPILGQLKFRLAEYYYADEKYPQAIKAYESVVKLSQKDLIPFSLYGLGWAHLRGQENDKAAASFTKLIDNYSAHKFAGPSLYARAMALQQSKKYEKALLDLKNFVQTDISQREKSDAAYLRGLCEIGLKKYSEASKSFQSILRGDTDYIDSDKVMYELGWALKYQKKNSDAIKVFNALTSKFPTSNLASEANYHVGEGFYKSGAYDKAAERYLKARAGAGENAQLKEKSTYKLGWAQFQSGNYEKAIAEFQNQSKSFPNSKMTNDAVFMQGESFFKMQKYDEALERFTSIRNKPKSSEQVHVLSLLHAGQSAAQLKKWDESINWLEEVRIKHSKSPYRATAMYELGWAYQNKNRLNKSIELYTETTKLSRGEVGARARFMIGEIFYSNQQYDRAILEFQKVMYGYGAEKASESIRRWQAKAGYEAGQCAGLLASQQRNNSSRRKQIDAAKKYFTYVVRTHPKSKEANAAGQQLKKYSRL